MGLCSPLWTAKKRRLVASWMFILMSVCLQVTVVRSGEVGSVLLYNSHFVGLGFLLCELLRDVQGERFISQKIQEVESNWKITSNLIHSRLFSHWLRNKKKGKKKKTINFTSYLVLARMNCCRQLYCVLLFLSTGAQMLLRPLIRRAPLQIHSGTRMSLEQRGESYLINFSSRP